MDISSDGALIVTGSADKNLKIWGMDFGDCHKSIFAHSDRYVIQFQRYYYYYRQNLIYIYIYILFGCLHLAA